MGLKKGFLRNVILAALLPILFLYGHVFAAGQCNVKLPALCPDSTPEVTALIHANELEACAQILDPSNQSYFDITFTSLPPGSDLFLGGTPYLGWCIDLLGAVVQDSTYNFDLYSSLAPPAFLSPLGIPWGSINYLLNNRPPNATWLDFQAAIWTLVNGFYPSNFPFGNVHGCPSPKPVQSVVDAMVAAATANAGFVPAPGQKFGIILIPLIPGTCEPDILTNPASANPKQISIIESQCQSLNCPNGPGSGEHPYIGIVGNDNTANPFYFSPKLRQFACDQTLTEAPVCSGDFPAAYGSYGAGCEQFRSSAPVIQPEICDIAGAAGEPNAVVKTQGGSFEWYIRLPKLPLGPINLVFQCGILKPNTFAELGFEAVTLCSAWTGEIIGNGFCTPEILDPGHDTVKVAALPTVTAMAYPGPYNDFTAFNLTAFRNPGTYTAAFNGSGRIQNDKGLQVLDGGGTNLTNTNGTRILLKSCMDKTVVVKLPVAGQLNALGQPETDLVQGDIIYVKLTIPRGNTVDVYCSSQSLKIMGIGE